MTRGGAGNEPRAHLERSLAFLEAAHAGRTARIIDVGGGASTFVDDLLDCGYENLTVLDVFCRMLPGNAD